MSERPHRRELLKPVQLLGIAFACAAFAGIVTFVVMGAFQDGVGLSALPMGAIVAGITFIVVLLGLSLLLLAVDPAQFDKTVERGVLLEDEDEQGDVSGR